MLEGMLDMVADGIVLASIKPDTNTVRASIDLDSFDALSRKRPTAFRASQGTLPLSDRRSSHTSCRWENSGIHRRGQQRFAREPDPGAVHAMREGGRPNGLHPQ
jgi:hypothetical protein